MRVILSACVFAAMILSISGLATANVITLQFSANDIFNYAGVDDTRLNQQGTARAIWGQGRTALDINGTGTPGRYYQTYNDGVDPYDRMDAATAAKDLQSVANILDWNASAGHQGINWIQLYLQGGNAPSWGEKVVLKSGTMSPSANGEFGWTASLSGPTPVFETILGGDPATNQNAVSLDYNPAETVFSVTADFFYDANGNGIFDSGDSDLVAGIDYTIWFMARLNNWTYSDDYGTTVSGNPGYIEGTIIASAVPIPSALLLLATGILSLVGIKRRAVQ